MKQLGLTKEFLFSKDKGKSAICSNIPNELIVELERFRKEHKLDKTAVIEWILRINQNVDLFKTTNTNESV